MERGRNLSKLYRGGKIFFTLLKYKIDKKPVPVCVHLQTTKRCNLKCIYCYANVPNLKNEPDLKFSEFVTLVDELASMGTKWIRLLGGEPLLRKDIGEMIDYAKSKGMFTELNTNGYFMKSKRDDLKNLDSLVISIDGTKETNDKCRGKGSYDKAIEAIEIAKDLKMPIRLHGCLSKYHKLEDIEHLAKLAVKYKAAFNVSAPSPLFFSDDVRMTGHPSQEQAAALHKKCLEMKALGYPLSNTDVSAKYVEKWPNPESDVIRKEDLAKLKIPKDSYVQCKAGKTYCCVDVDGKVYACASLWRNGLSYKKVGFKKAWEHVNNIDCLACNYLANIELNLLLGLNHDALFEAGSYLLGRRRGKKKKVAELKKEAV